MKYFAEILNDFALYYDTDLNRAFYLSKSYAKKHKNEICGVSVEKHHVVFDKTKTNKLRHKTIIKAKLAGLYNKSVSYFLDICVKDVDLLKVTLIVNFEADYCAITFDSVLCPLALEDFLKLVDENCFMSSLDYLYELYGLKIGIERDLFVNAKLKSSDCDDDLYGFLSTHHPQLARTHSNTSVNNMGYFTLHSHHEYESMVFDSMLLYAMNRRKNKEETPLHHYWYEKYIGRDTKGYDNINDWLKSIPSYIGCFPSEKDLLKVPNIELNVDRKPF